MAGCGPQFLRARSAADRALYRAISERVTEMRVLERNALARQIRNEIAAAFKG